MKNEESKGSKIREVPHGLRIENDENKRILDDFRNYLLIDRQLEEGTVERHILEIKKLFKSSDFNPLKAERSDIRKYLMRFKDLSPYSYANILKALRVFYRDYLGKPEIIQGFKFPSRPYKLVKIPSKKDLKEFYSWLKEPLAKAMFLIYATTGLRRKEVLSLKIEDIDFERRMIIPGVGSRTKKTWITFYNGEAEEALREYLGSFKDLNKKAKLFPVGETYFRERYKAFERETGIKITPQILREWFACEMGRLGVPDILARHYTDFNPEKLKEIYDKANLKVFPKVKA
jgi:integrase